MAEEKGRHPQLLDAVMEINADRRRQLVEKVRAALGDLNDKTIGLLGLTFKPNTDDMRDAPSIDIAQLLGEAGAKVLAYDPVGMDRAKAVMPDVEMVSDPYTLAKSCQALVVCTEWNEFKQLDLERLSDIMSDPLIVDGRNIYDPRAMAGLGIRYFGMGRGYSPDGQPVRGTPA